jgi:hypothetical protein
MRAWLVLSLAALAADGAAAVSLRTSLALGAGADAEALDGDNYVFLQVTANTYTAPRASDGRSKWCGSACTNGAQEVVVDGSLTSLTAMATSGGPVGKAQVGDVCWSRRANAGDSYFLRAATAGTDSVTASFFVGRMCGDTSPSCEPRPWLQVTLSRAQVTSSKLDSSGTLRVCLRPGAVAVRIKSLGSDGKLLPGEDFTWSIIENRAISSEGLLSI